VLDLIAHSEKTPTAAASALVTRVQQQSDRIELGHQRLVTAARQLAMEARRILDARARRAVLAPRALLAAGHQRSTHLARGLGMLALRTLRAADTTLRQRWSRLPVLASSRMQLELERLQSRAGRCKALDPRNVLRRGFAMLRDELGRLVSSATRVQAGARIAAELRDGTLAARVEEVHVTSSTGEETHGG
jgi:exodeoxyribonuclease VII large subunit